MKYETVTAEAASAIHMDGFAQETASFAGEFWALVVLNPTLLLNIGRRDLHQPYIAERASDLGTDVDNPIVHDDVWVIFHEDTQGFTDVITFDTALEAEQYWNVLLKYLPAEEDA